MSGAAGRMGGVLRGANITLLGAGLGGALAIVNEVLCARTLGVNAYGLYAFALIVARIAEGVATLGLPVGTLHHLAIHREHNHAPRVLGTILASLLPPLLVGGLFSAALWLLAPWLTQRVFGSDAGVPFVQALALAIPLMSLSEVLGVITRGFGHAAYYVLVRNLVPPLVFLALLLAIGLFGVAPQRVPVAFVAAYAVAVLVGVAAVLHVMDPGLRHQRPQWPLRALYGYSLPVLANQLLYLVVATVPLLLLGAHDGDKAVGIFRACLQLVIPFDMVVGAFNAAAGRHYAVLAHQGRQDELVALVERLTGYLAPLSMLGLLVVALNRHDLMRMMGPDFSSGTDTLMLLAAAQALLCAVGTAGYVLVMSGRQRHETFNAAMAALGCVAIALWLIPRHGGEGAAAATLLACVLVSALRVVQVRRLTGIRILGRVLGRNIVIALLTAAVMTGAMRLPALDQGAGLTGIVLRNLLMLALFVALQWQFGLDRTTREQLRRRWATST